MDHCLNQGFSGIKGLEISNLKFATPIHSFKMTLAARN